MAARQMSASANAACIFRPVENVVPAAGASPSVWSTALRTSGAPPGLKLSGRQRSRAQLSF